MLELNDVLQASERIRPYIVHTPLLRTPALDELIGCQVYIKPEMFQLTGSFKVRGASSRITLLTQQERERGVVTASSGNHAKAIAYTAKKMGIRATVVMPENPNPAKLAGIRKSVDFAVQENSLYPVYEYPFVVADRYPVLHPALPFVSL